MTLAQSVNDLYFATLLGHFYERFFVEQVVATGHFTCPNLRCESPNFCLPTDVNQPWGDLLCGCGIVIDLKSKFRPFRHRTHPIQFSGGPLRNLLSNHIASAAARLCLRDNFLRFMDHLKQPQMYIVIIDRSLTPRLGSQQLTWWSSSINHWKLDRVDEDRNKTLWSGSLLPGHKHTLQCEDAWANLLSNCSALPALIQRFKEEVATRSDSLNPFSNSNSATQGAPLLRQRWRNFESTLRPVEQAVVGHLPPPFPQFLSSSLRERFNLPCDPIARLAHSSEQKFFCKKCQAPRSTSGQLQWGDQTLTATLPRSCHLFLPPSPASLVANWQRRSLTDLPFVNDQLENGDHFRYAHSILSLFLTDADYSNLTADWEQQWFYVSVRGDSRCGLFVIIVIIYVLGYFHFPGLPPMPAWSSSTPIKTTERPYTTALRKALQFHMVMFLNDPLVKAQFPDDLGYKAACEDAKKVYQSDKNYDSYENPSDVAQWEWDKFLDLPATLPVLAALLNLRLVVHGPRHVEIYDGTSKGSVRHFTGLKAHYQPNHNELSTFHVLGDNQHYDLVIPFGRVFPKDRKLNKGFVESLQAYHATEQYDSQSKELSTGLKSSSTPPSPAAHSASNLEDSVSSDENEFTDDLIEPSKQGKRPVDDTQPSSPQDPTSRRRLA